MTLLLALDTSTSAITVALHDGERVVAQEATVDARRHTEALAPTITAVLAAAGRAPTDLTAVVVGNGPGPFTGLRVGMVTGTMLAESVGVPVHGVCSLDALAHAAVTAGDVTADFVVATDARRKEVYWARYTLSDNGFHRVFGPAVDHPDVVAESLAGATVVGRGAVLYPDLLAPAAGPLDVAAGSVAEVALAALARGEDLPVEPLYLRRPDAVPTAERAAATGRP